MKLTLFLDYDGVLHPAEVFIGEDGKPELNWPDDPSLGLFAWAPILDEIINEFDPLGDKIRIVISSTWGHHFGWEKAAEYLPQPLKDKVVGGTDESFSFFTRYKRAWPIMQYIIQNNIENWLAVDDTELWLWPDDMQKNVIKCNSAMGLSEPAVQEELRMILGGLK